MAGRWSGSGRVSVRWYERGPLVCRSVCTCVLSCVCFRSCLWVCVCVALSGWEGTETVRFEGLAGSKSGVISR